MTTSTKTQKGLLGTKLGMTQVWDENNRLVPVTVIQAGPNVVTQVRTPRPTATRRSARLRRDRPAQGHQAAHRPLREGRGHPAPSLVELRTADAADYSLGQELGADTFEAGQSVDVTGTTKGKGFAGVMKRHGFKGVSSSHGSHRNHRKPGSIGGCLHPGRVFKGMRMAGRMGGVRQTTQNLTVHAVDAEKGLLLSRVPSPAPAAPSSRPLRREGGRDPHGNQDAHRRPPRGDLRRADQRPADPPGRRRPSSRQLVRARTPPRPAATCAVVAASPTSRRAPAAPVRARPAHRSSPVVASSTARSRVTTRSAPPRR
jgi:large subunit ribosomal protein L3